MVVNASSVFFMELKWLILIARIALERMIAPWLLQVFQFQ